MLVKDVMSKTITTVTPEMTIREAKKSMEKNRVRHLPVIDHEERLVGVITERDIYDLITSSMVKGQDDILSTRVSKVMTTDVMTSHPLEFVEDLATFFYEHRIGAIPVVKDEELVGIITKSDVLYTLIQLTGAHQPSSIIEVKVENTSGQLATLAAIIGKRKTNITSVLVYPGENDRFKRLIFRVQTMDPLALVSDIKAKGYDVTWPNFERDAL